MNESKPTAEPHVEYIVLHAPGWPGGYNPVPNTLESGRAFVAEHGGELRHRWTSAWELVDQAGRAS